MRIIGGTFRGRSLRYVQDPRTRPMKDRVRESVFNLLGPDVRGSHALDLFAGTAALGFEAVSRGAIRASFWEQHFPTADAIRSNARELNVADRCQVHAADTFIWFRRPENVTSLLDPAVPWVVFCSPPYDFYVDRHADMLRLLGLILGRAPEGSMIAVEADGRFDWNSLPLSSEWDIRTYPPAVVGLITVSGKVSQNF